MRLQLIGTSERTPLYNHADMMFPNVFFSDRHQTIDIKDEYGAKQHRW